MTHKITPKQNLKSELIKRITKKNLVVCGLTFFILLYVLLWIPFKLYIDNITIYALMFGLALVILIASLYTWLKLFGIAKFYKKEYGDYGRAITTGLIAGLTLTIVQTLKTTNPVSDTVNFLIAFCVISAILFLGFLAFLNLNLDNK